jgi:DNA-binding LacI/PurR family transcriptional regulator
MLLLPQKHIRALGVTRSAPVSRRGDSLLRQSFRLFDFFSGLTPTGTAAGMKHKTIIDIAKRLKLSPSTISRALNNHPDIKESTRAKIKKIAVEFNYRPNPIAQSLKKNRTNTIGVLVPEIKHDFFSSAISGIEEISYKSGYTIILCQSDENYEREVVNTNLLMHQRVAGVIVSISENTKFGGHFNDLLNAGIPIAFFDRSCNDVVADKIVIDDYKSAFDAVTYLVTKGYRRIAHFAGSKALEISQKRMKGFADALKQANLPLFDEFVIDGDLHEFHGYKSMDELFKKKNIPDAIFAVNDIVAMGAFRRIKEAGLRIPEDIAVMGFSNSHLTTMVSPTLTVVDQFPYEMGKKAASMLIEMIEGRRKKPKTFIIESKLIIREST